MQVRAAHEDCGMQRGRGGQEFQDEGRVVEGVGARDDVCGLQLSNCF